MSTRYVYGIYDTTVAVKKRINTVEVEETDAYPRLFATPCESYTSKVAYARDGTPMAFYADPNREYPTIDANTYLPNNFKDYIYDTAPWKYVILTAATGNEENSYVSECYLLEFSSSISGAFWHICVKKDAGIGRINVLNSNSSGALSWNSSVITTGDKPFYKSGGAIEKGNTLSRHQSSSSRLSTGAYVSGSSWGWREYRGSDNIDASAVSYSVSDLYSGEPFTINVTPKTPTYGGTVYYQYQYSTNVGSTWTNIGSRTTATSATVTIPEGAEKFHARVLASDDWGFTSSTYVYGPAMEVSQLKAYVGSNAKAGSLKKGYVGVGEKAVALKKGYVGVGGKAKKLF